MIEEITLRKKNKIYIRNNLITSTIRVYSTNAEVMGDHSAIYFEVFGDSSSPYLYDPNGSYNPYKKIRKWKWAERIPLYLLVNLQNWMILSVIKKTE